MKWKRWGQRNRFIVRQRGYLIISVAPARQSLEELFLEAVRVGRATGGRGV